MKSMFLAHGFQSNNLFTLRHPSMGQRRPSLGRGLTAAEIDQYTAKITTGRQKLARINAWIESKRAAQPFGWTLFDDEALQANFFNWQKTANTEEDSVARVWEVLTNPSSADYDVNQDDLIRTNDWATMINWMTGAMEEYGMKKPGAVVGPTPGVKPGALPGAMPTAPSKGVSTNDLLVGGAIALGVGALLYAIL